MGLFSWVSDTLSTIGSAVGSLFSSSPSLPSYDIGSAGSRSYTSTSSTTYEPDRVKAAQIEADSKINIIAPSYGHTTSTHAGYKLVSSVIHINHNLMLLQ